MAQEPIPRTAEYGKEPIPPTLDENELAFQRQTPGSDQKYSTTEHGAATQVAEDRGLFHANKPTEGAVNDTMPEVGAPKKKVGVTEKVKDVILGVKDSITGHKQHDATSPTAAVTHPITHDDTTGTHHEKVGCLDKVNDFIKGHMPGHVATGDQHTTTAGYKPEVGSPGNAGHGAHGGQTLGDHHQQDSYGTKAEGWPQPVPPSGVGQHHANAPTPAGATYTDPSGKPVEGPKADDVKKEGLMSKMMNKLHPGTHKDTPHQ